MAVSATPGSAWRTCSFAGHSSRPTSSVVSEQTSRASSTTRRLAHWAPRTLAIGAGVELPRLARRSGLPVALAGLVGDQHAGSAGVVDLGRLLGGAGRLAPCALRRGLLRLVVAEGDRWS